MVPRIVQAPAPPSSIRRWNLRFLVTSTERSVAQLTLSSPPLQLTGTLRNANCPRYLS
jgi:hypothetical protein